MPHYDRSLGKRCLRTHGAHPRHHDPVLEHDTSGQLGAEGSSAGGLGWIIFQNQMENQTAYVFAGLFSVIIVGIVIENGFFRNIEDRTVRKWGMQQS